MFGVASIRILPSINQIVGGLVQIRYGNNGDGGYVVADLDIKDDCYISAGIAEEESFTKDFTNIIKEVYLKKINI